MTSPKIFIHSADSAGKNDGTVTAQLLDFLPNKVSSVAAADVVLTVCTFMPDYHFNKALYDVKKPVVVLDFLEFGWDAGERENRLGHDSLKLCGHLNTPGYAALDQWVKDCSPRLTFKRELFKKDVTDNMKPVEWLVYLPTKGTQTKEQFDARVFDCFFAWGNSNPLRFTLHGDVFKHANTYGYNVVDSFAQEQHLEKRNFASIYVPWFRRASIENVLRWQRRSKISVSLWGAGKKCFRSGESCVDCIMALPYDSLAWTYPFNHGENCIRLRPDHMLEDLIEATRRDNLYEIYLNSIATSEFYRSNNYVSDYIIPAIVERL